MVAGVGSVAGNAHRNDGTCRSESGGRLIRRHLRDFGEPLSVHKSQLSLAQRRRDLVLGGGNRDGDAGGAQRSGGDASGSGGSVTSTGDARALALGTETCGCSTSRSGITVQALPGTYASFRAELRMAG